MEKRKTTLARSVTQPFCGVFLTWMTAADSKCKLKMLLVVLPVIGCFSRSMTRNHIRPLPKHLPRRDQTKHRTNNNPIFTSSVSIIYRHMTRKNSIVNSHDFVGLLEESEITGTEQTWYLNVLTADHLNRWFTERCSLQFNTYKCTGTHTETGSLLAAVLISIFLFSAVPSFWSFGLDFVFSFLP